MIGTAPPTPPPSQRFLERDQRLRGLRRSVLAFAVEHDLLAGAACACGRRECAYPTAASFARAAPTEELLHEVRIEWVHSALAAQRRREDDHEARLRDELLAFGTTFHLWRCACVRQPCSHRDPGGLPLRSLLAVVDDAWHAAAGCHHHRPTEGEVEAARRGAQRNRRLVERFRAAAGRRPDALHSFHACAASLWYAEAEHLAIHCVDSWRGFGIDLVGDLGAPRACAPRATADRPAWPRLVDGAVLGLSVYGVADGAVTEALYEPFQRGLPLNELLLGLC